MDIGARQFIEDQLRANNVYFRVEKTDFALSCPFHSHSGKKQNLKLSFDGKKMHCYACQNGNGTYNKLADQLGLQRMPQSASYAFDSVTAQIEQAQQLQARPSLPAGLEPFDEPYRGLDGQFLQRFESKKWFDTASRTYRVLWPIRYNGKLLGWTAGRLDSDTEPKYRSGPPGVFRAAKALWPIDDAAIKRVVVLVEGPFSALRLLSCGVPAVAILGTGVWHSSKLSMLEQRDVPVRGIVIAMDGDDAGWQATKTIWEAAKDRFQRVEIFEMPVDRDPGDCSPEWVERIRVRVQAIERDVNGAARKAVTLADEI